ncbi:hypothetical protein LCI18_000576 [Fusarium solani-melongenae]|uniref:Uncharacterized protein n=1 Tax=Fusarium solani subsp. cucurbitae TaxID=2747967 RepID=A0ACD3YL83_FUSSC|nr:hypothetical protein LCI18_000576 [Fusarium solani-melongenae]
MSDTFQPAKECDEALKPGTNIFVNICDYFPDPEDESNELIELGCGSLSYVLYEPGQSFVIKKPHSGFSPSNSELVRLTEREADMTMDASQVLSKLQSSSGISVKVPGNAKSMKDWKEFGSTHGESLSDQPYRFPTPAIEMDIIYPLPNAVGRALIQEFHPKRAGSTMDLYVVEEILNQPKNKHCLVQPCLGLDARPREPGDFSLHHFQLSLADMHRIGINVVDLSRAIGEAFAVIHFDCGLSGTGVEFAFGLSKPKRPCSRCLYTVDLYLFDFGDCWKDDIGVGTEGLHMADNMLEPETRKFIPSPMNSPILYKVFKDAYIEHAKKSLGDESSPLPCNVMKHYERLAARELL